MKITANSIDLIGRQNAKTNHKYLRLPGVEPGSIAWKAIILTVGLQTLFCLQIKFGTICINKLYDGIFTPSSQERKYFYTSHIYILAFFIHTYIYTL